MKIAIINRSVAKGGAAVVSTRLADALRAQGAEVSFVALDGPRPAGSRWQRMRAFLLERLAILFRLRLRRERLFQIDTASRGLPLWKLPEVRQADVLMLNWFNQGMLSLNGLEKLLELGKPVVWTMHDMWPFTGICHHAYGCDRYLTRCADCPLLANTPTDNPTPKATRRTLKKALSTEAPKKDLSTEVWVKKSLLYGPGARKRENLVFVAVSNWLARRARQSSLLRDARIEVIPNAFRPLPPCPEAKERVLAKLNDQAGSGTRFPQKGEKLLIMGAARIDDPVKGPETLVEMTKALARLHPAQAAGTRLVTFGELRNPEALAGVDVRGWFAVDAINRVPTWVEIPHTHLGPLAPEEVAELMRLGSVVLSTSHWETLPGTLVEGLAYGCRAVAFDHGGQSDIITGPERGRLVPWSDNPRSRGEAMAAAVAEVLAMEPALPVVAEEFREEAVAKRYLALCGAG